jgi:hypothetical protein
VGYKHFFKKALKNSCVLGFGLGASHYCSHTTYLVLVSFHMAETTETNGSFFQLIILTERTDLRIISSIRRKKCIFWPSTSSKTMERQT